MTNALQLAATAALLAIGSGGPLLASNGIAVAWYDMPNGDGQASGGSFNYWDKNYSGVGATTTDGAPLAGGVGDLTNGVVASSFWFLTENGAGEGPYVGWYTANTLNPTVNFQLLNFALEGRFEIDSIAIHIDNSWVGGVFAPAEIRLNGSAVPFTGPGPGSIGWVTLDGLSGVDSLSPISLQFVQDRSGWVFVSEVRFFGSWVPEPASWGMMIAGFGLVGSVLRRRRMLPA